MIKYSLVRIFALLRQNIDGLTHYQVTIVQLMVTVCLDRVECLNLSLLSMCLPQVSLYD